jgi:hypothetical protein
MTKTMKSKIMMIKIIMKKMKTTVILTLKTVTRIMRNITTVPTKIIQTTTHHTIQMVKVVTKTTDLGNGERDSSTLDTKVSPSTD